MIKKKVKSNGCPVDEKIDFFVTSHTDPVFPHFFVISNYMISDIQKTEISSDSCSPYPKTVGAHFFPTKIENLKFSIFFDFSLNQRFFAKNHVKIKKILSFRPQNHGHT